MRGLGNHHSCQSSDIIIISQHVSYHDISVAIFLMFGCQGFCVFIALGDSNIHDHDYSYLHTHNHTVL